MGGIRIRPHHLLCIQGFRGQGYSPTFIANMARLKEMLTEAPDTPVQLTDGTDDICGFCPHADDGICMRPGQRVNEIDRRTLDKLELDDGAQGTWSDFVECIRDKLPPDQLGEVCHGCSWIDLGFCANGLDSLSRGRDLS